MSKYCLIKLFPATDVIKFAPSLVPEKNFLSGCWYLVLAKEPPNLIV